MYKTSFLKMHVHRFKCQVNGDNKILRVRN